ncbi:MAG: hypothetical protein ACXWKG_13575 [Limisphaerales bacterium]
MKKRLIAVGCAVSIGFLSVSSARAVSSEDVAADAVIVRPMCFVATILGSVAFVVTLPFTAPCGGVHTAADALVVKPAHATFVRELGDMESLTDD